MRRLFSTALLGTALSAVEGLANALSRPNNKAAIQPCNAETRRTFVTSSVVASFLLLPAATPANARYVLNEETGDYDEVEDPDWKTEWKTRLDKAQSMTKDEVFMAARGAGNTDLKGDGPESDASKKRRAMAGCRDAATRERAGAIDAKDCAARVLGGELEFVLNAM